LKNEFVNHLDDLILRRTVIALSGELTSELFIELADIYSDFFQLNLDVKSKEIERTKAILTQKHGVNLNV
jgi:glycerol-3-phosphate dehydrogenase